MGRFGKFSKMGLRRTKIGELFTRVMKHVLRNYLFALWTLEDGIHKGIEANQYHMNYSFSCLINYVEVFGYQIKTLLLVFGHQKDQALRRLLFKISLLGVWVSNKILLLVFDILLIGVWLSVEVTLSLDISLCLEISLRYYFLVLGY